MSEPFDKFIIVYQEYFLASGQDTECAAILKIIESLSKANSGEKTSWVSISAKSIEKLTFGVVPKRGVSRKIKALKSRGLIDVRSDENNWPSYKLNLDSIREMALLEFEKQGPEEDEGSTQNVYSSTDLVQGYPSTQNVLRVYTKCVDINSIKNSIKEEKKKRREEQLPPLREENISQTETVGERETIQLSLLTEKEKSTEQKEETELNPEVRTLLKSYDKIPKAKRDRFCKGSLNSLYKTYGDALERLTSEYGIDSCLDALEKFKQDEFWGTRGFPLRGFASQIERFLENASEKPGGYRRVERREKIEARPVSAQMPAAQSETPAPLFASDEKADRVKKIKRREDARCIIAMTLPDLLPDFAKDTDDIDSAESAVIERWFQNAREKWKETHGGFEPPCSTRPLC